MTHGGRDAEITTEQRENNKRDYVWIKQIDEIQGDAMNCGHCHRSNHGTWSVDRMDDL